MKRSLRPAIICSLWSFLVFLVSGEAVGEEIWYGADGKVVKRVVKTNSGADRPQSSANWEPSWVAREREQARRLAQGRRSYASSRYRTPAYYYGLGPYFHYPRITRYSSWHRGRCYIPYRSGWYGRAGGGRLIINYSK